MHVPASTPVAIPHPGAALKLFRQPHSGSHRSYDSSRARPHGGGSSGGNDPTMRARETRRMATNSSRGRHRERQTKNSPAAGAAKVARTMSREVRNGATSGFGSPHGP